jgi:hypothetical protein
MKTSILLGCVVLASSCATVARSVEPTLGSLSFHPQSRRMGAAKSNSWSLNTVFGERTSLTQRPDGSWAGSCKGGTIDVKPVSEGVLEGVEYRTGGAQVVHLVVQPPHLAVEHPIEELHVEGEELLPQSYLALYCLGS